MKTIIFLLPIFLLTYSIHSAAQTTVPLTGPTEKNYQIADITVSGATHSDAAVIIAHVGLKKGDQVSLNGSSFAQAIKQLWRLRLFSDVQIHQTKIVEDAVFIEISVVELPQLALFKIMGIKKTWEEELNKKLQTHLMKGAIVMENDRANALHNIKDFLIEKGYPDASIETKEVLNNNKLFLTFFIKKGERIKIESLTFYGNHHVTTEKLKKLMQETKAKPAILTASKLVAESYEADKKNIITYYQTLGFRNAKIRKDSIGRTADGHWEMYLLIEEGVQYYFRNITWRGNAMYSDKELRQVLGIKEGDIFNPELLEQRLRFSPDGRDISSLYMDNGYLFFQVNPVEVGVENNQVDLEIQIFEGAQATIGKVTISGNTRTNEEVIRRELRTQPGQTFSRADLIRSQRALINLGYFNPETLTVNTPVNPQHGTVDIEYIVEEKNSDQFELSAGWQPSSGEEKGRIVGTLGLTLNNFSVKQLFQKEAWNPMPQGDGQQLSLRAQSSGTAFQAYNVSFTEPWLGGKEPRSFGVSAFHQRFTNGQPAEGDSFASLQVTGGKVHLASRLKFPDDNFIARTTLSYQHINLNKYSNIELDDGSFINSGQFNNLYLEQSISRSTVNDLFFPTSGSNFELSGQFTLPYSLLNKNNPENAANPYQWLEYHKWKFNADWYTSLTKKLVLKASAKMGLIGTYNKNLGTAPFERFELGGSGTSSLQASFTGNDIYSLRGYEADYLEGTQNGGGAAFSKFSVELRYLLLNAPAAKGYVLAFADGGNIWKDTKDFNPFDVRRSVGLGFRVQVPMLGLIGFDYGFGIDKPEIDNGKWTDYAKLSIIFGFEPQ